MKSKTKNLICRIIASAAGTSLLLSASALHAQSCALCYQSAAASGSHFIQALKDGILILLVPPLFISAGIGVMAYLKRNQCLRAGKTANREFASATDTQSWKAFGAD
jgi:hypothetical protein